tara:strand:+ start:362 stop:679 length:318 start_codon:yes stop_codon:yes gene_type:complete
MKTYYAVIKMLRDEVPAKLPVHIRRIKMKRDGYCMKKDEKFYIRINKEFTEDKAIDTLLHEWAHALTWMPKYDWMDSEEFEKVIHGPSWGIAYSEVYQLFEKHFT